MSYIGVENAGIYFRISVDKIGEFILVVHKFFFRAEKRLIFSYF